MDLYLAPGERYTFQTSLTARVILGHGSGYRDAGGGSVGGSWKAFSSLIKEEDIVETIPVFSPHAKCM